MTYNAHHLPIHRIDFNKYNSNIFASCGADWLKIWEDMRRYSIIIIKRMCHDSSETEKKLSLKFSYDSNNFTNLQ